MLDGNGVLHPRSFGIACHLGVLADIPTIGVAKNLLVVDGLDAKSVKEQTIKEQRETDPSIQQQQYTKLVGESGKIWGGAIVKPNQCKPIYVSIGHRIGLDTAVTIVKRCQLSRIPEPIRQADLRSREYVNCTLLVKNLLSSNEDEIRSKFGVYGDIRGICIYNDDDNNNSSFAFVTFYKKNDATKALEGFQNMAEQGPDGGCTNTWEIEFATQPKGDPEKKKQRQPNEDN